MSGNGRGGWGEEVSFDFSTFLSNLEKRVFAPYWPRRGISVIRFFFPLVLATTSSFGTSTSAQTSTPSEPEICAKLASSGYSNQKYRFDRKRGLLFHKNAPWNSDPSDLKKIGRDKDGKIDIEALKKYRRDEKTELDQFFGKSSGPDGVVLPTAPVLDVVENKNGYWLGQLDGDHFAGTVGVRRLKLFNLDLSVRDALFQEYRRTGSVKKSRERVKETLKDNGCNPSVVDEVSIDEFVGERAREAIDGDRFRFTRILYPDLYEALDYPKSPTLKEAIGANDASVGQAAKIDRWQGVGTTSNCSASYALAVELCSGSLTYDGAYQTYLDSGKFDEAANGLVTFFKEVLIPITAIGVGIYFSQKSDSDSQSMKQLDLAERKLTIAKEDLAQAKDDRDAAIRAVERVQDASEENAPTLEEAAKMAGDIKIANEKVKTEENNVQEAKTARDTALDKAAGEEPANGALTDSEGTRIHFKEIVWPTMLTAINSSLSECIGVPEPADDRNNSPPEGGQDEFGSCKIDQATENLSPTPIYDRPSIPDGSFDSFSISDFGQIISGMPFCFSCTADEQKKIQEDYIISRGFEGGFAEICARLNLPSGALRSCPLAMATPDIDAILSTLEEADFQNDSSDSK